MIFSMDAKHFFYYNDVERSVMKCVTCRWNA